MNKYGAKKVVTPSGAFDSQKEYRRYCELLYLQKAGKISDLNRQVKYELIKEIREPPHTLKSGREVKGKIIERSCDYIADFVYRENGQTVVEDVKGYRGNTGAYSVFVIKRKLMLEKYGIRVKEV